MYSEYNRVAVSAIAAAAPTKILDNLQYSESVQDRRYRRRILYTGITQRRTTVGNQCASDLAAVAAEAAMEKLGWEKESIRVLLFVTQSPDIKTPSTAMLIQAKLGLPRDIMAFDINLGCSGFTTGLQVMASLLNNVKGRGLLLMGDAKSYAPGAEFAADNILFGAGSAAVAMEYSEAAEPILCDQHTEGQRAKAIYTDLNQKFTMDGNEIVLFSLNEVVEGINQFHDHYGIDRNDVDFYALHQGQKIIVDGVANNCQLPPEKVLRIYQTYGNTSSATIPFALCGNTDRLTPGQIHVFSSGFGIGLAWSNALFSIDSSCVLPLIETDYVYPDTLGLFNDEKEN